MARIDLTGQRFGRLVVLSEFDRVNYKSRWLCRCDCGNEKPILMDGLRGGTSTSCGCYASECKRARVIKHGAFKTRLYSVWLGMKARCNIPSTDSYPSYGARGIQVCPEWEGDFAAFQTWALANGYAADLTIERDNLDGNYCPQNCRWVTAQEQRFNKRDTRYEMLDGQMVSVARHVKGSGLHLSTVHARLNRGWTLAQAISQPAGAKR